MDSDAIAVIANGKISELGTHETLLNKEDGIYRSLCESQGIKPSEDGSVTKPAAAATTESDIVRDSLALVSGDAEVGLAALDGLELEPENEEEEVKLFQEVSSASMSSIWRHVGWDSMYTLMGALGSAIVGALSPCESILTAEIVAGFYTVDSDQMKEASWVWISKFLYFALASLVGNCMVGIGLSRSGSNLGAKLRNLSFSAMMKKSMGWFDLAENSTGELTSILGGDA